MEKKIFNWCWSRRASQHTESTEIEKEIFYLFIFFLQRKRQNALLSKKRTYFVKWDMILFSELALGWKLKFMWSFLHLYSLAIILYNQKVLQPKGPSVLNYDIWKEPTGHPSLTKSERLHANTQTHAHTDTHTLQAIQFHFLTGLFRWWSLTT